MTLSIPLVRFAHGEGLPLPTYATPFSAGVDLMAAIGESCSLEALQRKLIPTGISISLPPGYEAQIRPRSGLALKHGLTVLNSPGTIDADYRGEIQVIIINLSSDPFLIERGLRIAQMVVAPVSTFKWTEVDQHEDFAQNERKGGFGSTGLRSSL
jgi:dUTP pyrophosphatase